MGGILILLRDGATLCWADLTNLYIWLILLVTWLRLYRVYG
jgi:hypothetical protein